MIKSENGFFHSVRVPRIYKVASKIAKDHSEGKGSISNLLYGSAKKRHPNVKAIFSLVSTVFARSRILESLFKRSNFFLKEPRCDPWLTKVLTVELLWGKGSLPGDSKPETTIRAYEQVFKAHLSDHKGLQDDRQEAPLKPRYVRVNTLKLSFEDAVKNFLDEGRELLELSDPSDYDEFLETVSALEEGQFLIDIHIPNLLIFAPKTEFHSHPAYKSGSIILQDKASCIPVHLLSPPAGSVVLDMCAAPGMKTTHAAAVLGNKGKIYAVERHPDRFESLCKIVESAGASCVEPIIKDVLSCTGSEFPDVEYILVDPSCTGSGMTKRDRNQDQSVKDDRMKSLAGFQIKILRSALSRYPKAKRVVYSTCSIYPEENEEVVRGVLETNYRFKLVPVKNLLDKDWKNFGRGDIGELCLYAKSDVDFTDGFFTAVFERVQEGETNQFFKQKVYDTKLKIQQEKRIGAVKNNSGGKRKHSVANEDINPDRKQHEIEAKLEKSCKKVNSNTQKDDLVINSVEENGGTAHGKPRKNKKNKINVEITEFDSNSQIAPRNLNSSKKKKRDSEDQSCEDPLDSFLIQIDKILEKSKIKLEAQIKEESEKSNLKAEVRKQVPDEFQPRINDSSKKRRNKSSKYQSCKEPQNSFIIDIEESSENSKIKVEAHKEEVSDEFESGITTSSKKKKNRGGKPQDSSIIDSEESSDNAKLKEEVSDEFESRIHTSSKKKKNRGGKPQDSSIIDSEESSDNPKLKEEASDEFEPRIITSSKKKKNRGGKPLDSSIIDSEESSDNPKLKQEVPHEFESRINTSSKKESKEGSKDQSCKEPQDPFFFDLEGSIENRTVKIEVLKNEVVDILKPGITSRFKNRASENRLYAEQQDPFIIESKPKEIPDEFEPKTNNSSEKKKGSNGQLSEESQDPRISQLMKILDKTEPNLAFEDSSSTVDDDEKLGSKKKKRKSSNIVDDIDINVVIQKRRTIK